MLRTEIRIAGLGGQGIILAGQVLGRAAVYERKNVVQTQSYGAEARGSIAKSDVILSDGAIGFPMARRCDILVAMSEDALNAYFKDLKRNGQLLVDTTFVKTNARTKAEVFGIPATEVSKRSFGSEVYANMIMLGALTKATGIVGVEALEKAIEATIPSEIIDINKQAFRKGLELVSRG